MKISVESLTTDLVAEILPLAQKSWDECSEVKKDTCAYHGQRGLSINPDVERYLFFAQQGALITVTLRDDRWALQGYSLIILYKSLHLKTELCGNIDSFFVQPGQRNCMANFMSEIERILRGLEVSIIAWPVTRTGNLYKILKSRGYIADDVVMELKLKNLQES